MTTPCHGRAALFEATTLAAHAEAAALCDTCPAIEACGALLVDTIRDYGYGPASGPRGTWAGRLVSAPKQIIAPIGSLA